MSEYRHEYKYFLDTSQKAILNIKAQVLLKKDCHVNNDNSYFVRSLYFDNINNKCLDDNLIGSDPRSKYRIRYYNNNLSYITLEKKTKYRGMCKKESIFLSKADCKKLIKGEIPTIKEKDSNIRKKLLTELRINGMFPNTIVTYERIPYTYPIGNIRITFDDNITSSSDIDHFLDGKYHQRSVLPLGQSLLEVKWDELIPKHIQNTIIMENLNWTAFSKYYMSRLMHL